MADDATRRGFVKIIGGLVGTGVLGLGLFLKSTNPIVGDYDTNGQLLGNTRVQARIYNRGVKGNVLVSAAAVKPPKEVLTKVSEEIHMESDVTRRMTFELNVPEEAEDIRVSATATDFPGNVLN